MKLSISRTHSKSKRASVEFEHNGVEVDLGLFDHDELDEFRAVLKEAMEDAEQVRDTLVREKR